MQQTACVVFCIEPSPFQWKQDPGQAASGALCWCIFDVAEEERGQCPSWFSTASCTNWNLIQSHLLHSPPMPLFHWLLIFGEQLPLTARCSWVVVECNEVHLRGKYYYITGFWLAIKILICSLCWLLISVWWILGVRRWWGWSGGWVKWGVDPVPVDVRCI